ncbi:MAG: diacylglycerol kinase family protein [Bacteroidales bacterium]
MQQERFSIKKRIHSFRYAFNGLSLFLKQEHNARIHVIASVFVVVVGFICRLSTLEWLFIVIAIGLVFAAEIFNTALEAICDLVHPSYHDKVKKIKDLAAGTVLVCAFVALCIGLIIFIPHLFAIIKYR